MYIGLDWIGLDWLVFCIPDYNSKEDPQWRGQEVNPRYQQQYRLQSNDYVGKCSHIPQSNWAPMVLEQKASYMYMHL